MTPVEKAARRYCGARDHERAIVAGLHRCKRRNYAIVRGEEGAGEFCSRVMVANEYDVDSLPQAEWCDACIANLPAVDELRRVRRSFPGLMGALRRAARKT